MSVLDADRWMAALLEDEAWQAPLDEASREGVMARLEVLLPPGASVDEATAARWQAAIRELAELVARLRAGELDEPALVSAWLRHGVA